MDTICLQCGDKGWQQAFVYCVECLEFGVHRFCLDKIPETLDEFVGWVCDFCKEEEPNQHHVLKESSIPSQEMNNPSPKHAVPLEIPVWSGEFSILKKDQSASNRFVAHLSNKASPKVCEEANLLEPLLHLRKLVKFDVWPKGFNILEPTDQNIDLYFFPADSSSEDALEELVEELIGNEQALKVTLANVELLLFSSTELPLRQWRMRRKYYLWGMFRPKKSSKKEEENDGEEEGPAENVADVGMFEGRRRSTRMVNKPTWMTDYEKE